LIDDALVLSALDAGGLHFKVLDRVLRLRLGTRHLTSRPVRTRIERLRVTKPLDDEGLRPHRARDDPESPTLGIYRTLSGNVNLIAEVLLDRNIVVMAVYDNFDLRFAICDRVIDIETGIEHAIKRFDQSPHHDLAVLHRVPLGPVEVVPIVTKLVRSLNEVGKIRRRELIEPMQRFRRRDVTLGKFLTDVSRT